MHSAHDKGAFRLLFLSRLLAGDEEDIGIVKDVVDQVKELMARLRSPSEVPVHHMWKGIWLIEVPTEPILHSMLSSESLPEVQGSQPTIR